jgi:hypothetical protein
VKPGNLKGSSGEPIVLFDMSEDQPKWSMAVKILDACHYGLGSQMASPKGMAERHAKLTVLIEPDLTDWHPHKVFVAALNDEKVILF